MARWSNQEKEYLKNNYKTDSYSEMKAVLDRSEAAIMAKARRMGISKGMEWEKEEEKYLLENYKELDLSDISSEINRSGQSIVAKASRMGISKVEDWSEDEVEYLTENYQNTWTEDLANEMDRSKSSIYSKASKLGLKSDRTLMRRKDIISSDLSPPNLSKYEKGFICGLISGEGSFVVRNERNDNKSFSITVMMKEHDVLREVRESIGYGNLYVHGDYTTYNVSDSVIIWNVIIPIFNSSDFMGAVKEQQFIDWKEQLKDYYDLE